MPFYLEPNTVGVGCILKPIKSVKEGSKVKCKWGKSMDKANTRYLGFNPCAQKCHLDHEGQKHPVVVVKIDGNSISYVQMTGTRRSQDRRDGTAVYSPIKHYFTSAKENDTLWTHSRRRVCDPIRSNYFLRVLDWSENTISQVRGTIAKYETLQLQKFSELRFPHVFESSLQRFQPFAGQRATAIDHRLDEGSYYRLMDRIGLKASHYTPDARLKGVDSRNSTAPNMPTPDQSSSITPSFPSASPSSNADFPLQTMNSSTSRRHSEPPPTNRIQSDYSKRNHNLHIN